MSYNQRGRGGQRGGHSGRGGRGGHGGNQNPAPANNNKPYIPPQNVAPQPAPVAQPQQPIVQQPIVVAPKPVTPAAQQPPVANDKIAAPVAKPQPKPHSAPIRTSSAPPDLEALEAAASKRGPSFTPIRSVPVQAPHVYTPVNYVPQPYHGYNPYANYNHGYQQPMPYAPPPNPQGDAPVSGGSFIKKPQKSSAIKIVNPNTGEEVKLGQESAAPAPAPVIIKKPEEKSAAITIEAPKPKEEPKPVEKVVEAPQQQQQAKEQEKPAATVAAAPTPAAEVKPAVVVAPATPASKQDAEEAVDEDNEKDAADNENDNKNNDDEDLVDEDDENNLNNSQGEDNDDDNEDEEEKSSDEPEIEVPKPDEATGKRLYSKDFLLKFKPLCNTPLVIDNAKFKDIFMTGGDQSPMSPKSGGKGGRGGNNKRGGKGGRGGNDRNSRGGKNPRTPAKREKPAWIAKLDANEHAATYAEVTDILNKLAPEKYDKLLQRFLTEVKIPTSDVMNECIVLIFDKAVLEPKFSDIYANLCFDLSEKLKLPNAGADQADNNSNAFKKMLLNKCQEEFESKVSDDENKTDEEREEELNRERKRMVGTIIFIGELYKKKMLSERIMHDVIKRLLIEKALPDEADLEVLCRLLGTIGQLLDHEKAAKHINYYFDKIRQLQGNKELSSRTRFMLLDTIELRANNWVPRVKQEKAKKIQEIKQDIEQEKLKQEMEIKKMYNSGSSGGRRGGKKLYDDDGRGSGNRRGGNSNSSSSSSSSRGYNKPSPIKTSSSYRNNDRAAPSSYGSSGSKGWNKQDKQQEDNSGSNSNSGNRFGGLVSDEMPDSPSTPAPDMDDVDLSDEAVAKHIKTLVGDLVEQEEIAEAIQDLKKVIAGDSKVIIKTFIVDGAKQTGNQDQVAKMLTAICAEQLFTKQQFADAVNAAFETAIQNEFAIESPQQWKNIAELSGRLTALKSLDLAQLAEAFKAIVDSEPGANSIADFLACIYGGIHKQSGEDKAALVEDLLFAENTFNPMQYLNPIKSAELERYLKGIKSFDLQDKDPVARVLVSVASGDSASLTAWFKSNSAVLAKCTGKILSALIAAIECNTTFARSAIDDKDLLEKYSSVFEAIVSTDANCQVQFLEELFSIAKRSKNDAIFTRVGTFAKGKGFITKDAMDEWSKNNAQRASSAKSLL